MTDSSRGAITELSSASAQHENNYKPDPEYFNHVRKLAERDCKLRHVRLSVRMEQLGCHRTDFHKISYLSVSETLSRTFNLRNNPAIMTGSLRVAVCNFMIKGC